MKPPSIGNGPAITDRPISANGHRNMQDRGYPETGHRDYAVPSSPPLTYREVETRAGPDSSRTRPHPATSATVVGDRPPTGACSAAAGTPHARNIRICRAECVRDRGRPQSLCRGRSAGANGTAGETAAVVLQRAAFGEGGLSTQRAGTARRQPAATSVRAECA